jgi:predicted PhzF superfamily epimerase YddE/YHI9
MKIPFAQIDAFASAAFTGNPAAVMPLEAWLADDVLQKIAAENNLAETAFIIPTNGDADYELRWFTPEVEVALCGHATLASGHYLLTRDGGDGVRFRTRKAGILEVRRAGTGYALDLPAWEAETKPLPAVCAALGGTPTETRWREGGYAIVAYADEAAVRALDPDFRALRALGDILTIATAPGKDTDVVSRVFAPGAGIDEDPVTGSAHCLLTPYWAERLGRSSFSAFQASARGGHVDCRLDRDRAVLGGQCVTVIEGQFLLG